MSDSYIESYVKTSEGKQVVWLCCGTILGGLLGIFLPEFMLLLLPIFVGAFNAAIKIRYQPNLDRVIRIFAVSSACMCLSIAILGLPDLTNMALGIEIAVVVYFGVRGGAFLFGLRADRSKAIGS